MDYGVLINVDPHSTKTRHERLAWSRYPKERGVLYQKTKLSELPPLRNNGMYNKMKDINRLISF